MAVPDTTTFNFMNVRTELINEGSGTAGDLDEAFNIAVDTHFNVAYKTNPVPNSLLSFRDYGAHNIPIGCNVVTGIDHITGIPPITVFYVDGVSSSTPVSISFLLYNVHAGSFVTPTFNINGTPLVEDTPLIINTNITPNGGIVAGVYAYEGALGESIVDDNTDGGIIRMELLSVGGSECASGELVRQESQGFAPLEAEMLNKAGNSVAACAGPFNTQFVLNVGFLSGTLKYIFTDFNGHIATPGYFSDGAKWKQWDGTAIINEGFC